MNVQKYLKGAISLLMITKMALKAQSDILTVLQKWSFINCYSYFTVLQLSEISAFEDVDIKLFSS